ncbi:colicin E5-related ribonuclease [Pandoraea sp. CB10b_02]|uniref:colicin E5-related ribonuclease n=1 Tax=Pandoraea sp. CB10b_02 TaxID=2014535 RepID=UPI002579E096|nr:colicin E5-related ribonuclease [Pandoraea sp. CB10b_02]
MQTVVNEGPVGTTMDNRSAGKTPDGLPRNDPASVYGSKSGYVVVNDRTRRSCSGERQERSWLDFRQSN